MTHKGFIPSAATFIRQVRQNLSEGRYAVGADGASIVKELVQNADDADATVLHIGLCDPLSGANHPLLQSPGLFVVNDGAFKRHDATNIRRFGENTKAMDAAKIGKFGLGLKSIFHLCEAFFFFGPVANGNFVADVLNPWSGDEGDNFHPEWDDFGDDDKQLLIKALMPLFEGDLRFSLWIPLRQKTQLRGNEPISHYFPGDEPPMWLSSEQLPCEIATLLPLLSSLRSVRGWSGAGQRLERRFEVALDDQSQRRRPFEQLAPAATHFFSGGVSIEYSNGDDRHVAFVGVELNPSDPTLARLEHDEHWPSDLGRDPESGLAKTIKEKAQQHAAVCLTIRRVRESQRGVLSISWAVFLPLGSPEIRPLDELGIDVSLLLHGYFFPNAGRTRPLGLDEQSNHVDQINNDEQLRIAWNQRLATIGTLPLVPSLLNEAMSNSRLGLRYAEMSTLTREIASSRLFAEYGIQICARNCWASLYESSHQRTWKLFPAAEPLLELPGSLVAERPWQVFPGLSALVSDFNVTLASEPRLVQHGGRSRWPSEAVTTLLDSVPPGDTCRHAERLDYLTAFLKQLAEDDSLGAHMGSIIRIARLGLCECGLSGSIERSKTLRSFLAFLPKDRRLPVSISGEKAEELFGELCRQEVDVVFVPTGLDSLEQPGNARLRSQDAIDILNKLAKQQLKVSTASERETVALLAARLLASAEEKNAVLASCSDLPLFVAKDCRKGSDADLVVSWATLNDRRTAKMLFVSPPPSLAYRLQSALKDEHVLLVSKSLFEFLFPDEEPPSCRQRQILETLHRSEKPALRAPSDRLALVEILLGFQAGRREPQFVECVRYLLHAEPTQFHSSAMLFISRQDESDVWRRIVLIALHSRNTEWRLVDIAFARRLTAEHKEEVAIQDLGPAGAVALIREAGSDAFVDLQPSPTEYSMLLREIDDDQLARMMPIHQDSGGAFVSIGDRCYWEGDTALPVDLEHSITVLRKSDNQATWRRQLELARQLDVVARIEILLGQTKPGKYWSIIMDSLAETDALSVDHWELLKTVNWLPTTAGGYVSPDNVIDLPLLSDEIARLTTSAPGIFVDPGMLEPTLRKHPAYDLLCRKTYPDAEDALSMVGEVLAENAANHIGPIRRESLKEWEGIAHEFPADLLPCGALIHRAAEHYSGATLRIFEQLAQTPIPIERIRRFLAFLRERHQQERNNRRRSSLLAVFNEYLRLAIQVNGYEKALYSEMLPTRLGEWRSSAELCCDSDGVALASVVDAATEETLAPFMPEASRNADRGLSFYGIDEGREPDWATIRPEIEAAGERLRLYFANWKDIIPNEQIGGFLSLLGDDPHIRELAQQFLGRNRTTEETRLNFGLPAMKAGDHAEDGLTMMSKQRVVVETVHDATVKVLNLLGSAFRAPRNETPQNIFVGYGKRHYPFPHTIIDGTRVICFRLNAIDPRIQNPDTLSKLLRDSAVKFVAAAYNSYEYQTTFSAAWDELAESDQLDIIVAQERVIENGFMILAPLGLRDEPCIAAVLDKWGSAQSLWAARHSGAVVGRTTGPRDADGEMRQAKVELRKLLEENEQAQSRILDAIRGRMSEDYQYTKACVPFEIFQNADDASVELISHFSITEEHKRDAQTFHIIVEPDQLTLAHFGRRINQYPLDGRDVGLGFDNDLWNMLVLSLSNKRDYGDDASQSVTGKFGLGFKSSYLIADRPRILSGRLAFEVVGAMYPRRLVGDERTFLDDCRARLLGSNSQATILQLPLIDGQESDALDNFRRLAHLLVIFARQIRRCIINGGEAETKWEPEPVSGAPRCFTGTIAPLVQDGQRAVSVTRGLLLETDHGSLLLALGARQVGAFSADVPTIWVTAPTEEALALGFLVNGPFALDVGRAQLARDFAQNRDRASDLGTAIARQVCDLFRVTEQASGWRTLRDELRLAKDATVHEFWDSLFNVLAGAMAKRANSESPADRLVRELFWAAGDRAAAMLYRTCQAIPTRMRGDYQRLVSVSEVRYSLKGRLAQDHSVFAELSSWDTVQTHAPPGAVVSHEHVFKPLEQLAPSMVTHIRPLTIETVLGWEFQHGTFADAETAKRLGSAINKRTFEAVQESNEDQELRRLLDLVEFKGKDHRYHPAKQLLLGHATDIERDERRDDERFRAHFAPDSRVLSEDYQGAAVAFFDVCRQTLDAPVRMMAEWVIEAGDQRRQIAALQYLAHGQLASGLISELIRRGLAGTWLANLASAGAFHKLDEASRARLLALLPEDARPEIDWDSLRGAHNAHVPPDPPKTLLAIHEWWRDNRDRPQALFDGRSFLQEYEHRTYPNGRPRFLASDESSRQNDRRKEWTTLLLLGLMHTIGRAHAGQHRHFIHDCDKHGWLDMFASQEPDPQRWIEFVRSYIEQQVDEAHYFHWMKQFVGIFQISRYLDDYIELFLAIDRISHAFALVEITQPLTSALFQGGGVSAPPLSRVLGLGACFVVRELIRLGILHNDLAHPHCYVPVKRVREIFKLMQCDGLDLEAQRWQMSVHIHSFVVTQLGTERARFLGDFDIPFQFIAEDESLQQRLFQQTVPDEDDDEPDLARFPL